MPHQFGLRCTYRLQGRGLHSASRYDGYSWNAFPPDLKFRPNLKLPREFWQPAPRHARPREALNPTILRESPK